jgi:surface polysaccharide O-acyltransferase-like enzyme
MNRPARPPSPEIDARLSEKLVGVSFLSACCIVMLHAYQNSMLEAGEATKWLALFAGWILPTFGVPLFFVISGYLLAVKAGCGTVEGWYGRSVKKRVRTLLVPYFLWCTLFAVTVLPFTMLGNHLAGRALTGNTCLREPLLSAWNLVRIYGGDLRAAPINGPMWYVRDLFLLVLLSPVFLKLMENRLRGGLFLLAAGALFFSHDWMPDSCWQFFETGFSLRGLLFFPLGIYLARHPVPADAFRRTRAALPVLWLGTCLAYVWLRLHGGEDCMTAKILLAKAANVLGVGGVWVLCDCLPGFRRMARLPVAKDSFFVYACHLGILFTVMCERSQQLLAARLHVPVAGIFLLRIAVPVALSLVLAEGLKRWFPKAHALLTGGR